MLAIAVRFIPAEQVAWATPEIQGTKAGIASPRALHVCPRPNPAADSFRLDPLAGGSPVARGGSPQRIP
ncbi:MAG: hypothetical protein ACK59A_13305 [Cyanobacteriota bacterium]